MAAGWGREGVEECKLAVEMLAAVGPIGSLAEGLLRVCRGIVRERVERVELGLSILERDDKGS